MTLSDNPQFHSTSSASPEELSHLQEAQNQSRVAEIQRYAAEINQLRNQTAPRSVDQIAEDKLRCQTLISNIQTTYRQLPYTWQLQLTQIIDTLCGKPTKPIVCNDKPISQAER